eukprot:7906010-Pyramimonas_sp.AAC.1
MALTATAAPRVQRDICSVLGLASPFVSQKSLDRPNLSLRILRKAPAQPMAAVAKLLKVRALAVINK